jgi:hypothetical protein
VVTNVDELAQEEINEVDAEIALLKAKTEHIRTELLDKLNSTAKKLSESAGSNLDTESPYVTNDPVKAFTNLMNLKGFTSYSVENRADGNRICKMSGNAKIEKIDEIDRLVAAFGETKMDIVNDYWTGVLGIVTRGPDDPQIPEGGGFIVEIWVKQVDSKLGNNPKIPTERHAELYVRQITGQDLTTALSEIVSTYAPRGRQAFSDEISEVPNFISLMLEGPAKAELDDVRKENKEALERSRPIFVKPQISRLVTRFALQAMNDNGDRADSKMPELNSATTND